jgi:hypothetical protein
MEPETNSCACGEYAVCINNGHPLCRPIDVAPVATKSSFIAAQDFDDDFGFSVVSEEEQRKMETTDKRLAEMREAIEILLRNLSMNPTSDLIKWPNRLEKIQAFRARLDAIQFSDPK